MRLQSIHKAISFTQAPIFRPYIEQNTQRRKETHSDFSKDFYKLKNNSLFGKTMEDKTKRIDFRLVTCKEKLLRLSWDPRFLSRIRFDEDLVGVLMTAKECLLDKPMIIGQSVLDLSKLLMYQWRYETFER